MTQEQQQTYTGRAEGSLLKNELGVSSYFGKAAVRFGKERKTSTEGPARTQGRYSLAQPFAKEENSTLGGAIPERSFIYREQPRISHYRKVRVTDLGNQS